MNVLQLNLRQTSLPLNLLNHQGRLNFQSRLHSQKLLNFQSRLHSQKLLNFLNILGILSILLLQSLALSASPVSAEEAPTLTTGRIKITNPHCLACIREAKNLLLQTKGVESVSMSPDLLTTPKMKTRRVIINLEYDGEKTNLKELKQLLREHDLEVIY